MQAAGVDPTSTRKLEARICAASRLLGFSLLSRLIFGIQGGNLLPQLYLNVTEQLSKQTLSQTPDGLFFSFFGRMMLEVAHERFFRGTKAPLSET